MRTRAWCFTLNNYTEDELNALRNLGQSAEYCILGKEIAPSTGMHHIQGFIRFTNPRNASSLKKCSNRIHHEKAKGTDFDNFTYCSKEKNFEEFGTRPEDTGPGSRSDLDEVRSLIRSGASIDQIWEQARSYQAFRMAVAGLPYRPAPSRPGLKVYWYWGATGCGKTWTALNKYPDAWMTSRNLKWWDGYYGQKCVIIDDFRPDYCSFPELLRILDIYPFRAEVKGGSVALEAEVIIITCPWPPKGDKEKGITGCYDGKCLEDIEQLCRRITEIVHFEKAHGTEVGGNTSAPTP